MGTETPHARVRPGKSNEIWSDVAQLAETIITSSSTPAGFIRKKLPIGRTRADVYATQGNGSGAGQTTVVVVIAPTGDAPPSRSELRRRFGLTPREAEVALLLATRRSNKEIARDLAIAPKTASRHTQSVMAKLRTSSRRDVARVLGWHPRSDIPARRSLRSRGRWSA